MTIYTDYDRFGRYVKSLGSYEGSDDLVEKNLKFVVSVARDYVSQEVTMEELVQAGNCGMVMARNHFNDDGTVTFATYAKYWIKKYIIEECNGRRLFKHRKGVGVLSLSEFDRDDNDPLSLGDVLISDKSYSVAPSETLESLDNHDSIRAGISELTEDERYVVTRYYGLDGGTEKVTYQEIGNEIGSTPQWVQLLNKTALKKLNNKINKETI